MANTGGQVWLRVQKEAAKDGDRRWKVDITVLLLNTGMFS
jgi:hypothetical protein